MKRFNRCGHKHSRAFTLVECLIAFTILMIAFLGIMGFRYYAVASAERAEHQLLAARSALLISEAWRASKADTSFNPADQEFVGDFEIKEASLSMPFKSYYDTLLGTYKITVDDKEFEAQLSYRNVFGVQNLRSINVLIFWKDHRGKSYEYYLPTFSQTPV